jgi:two-component system, NtrC family, sensor histidine kinase HydH
LLQEDNLELPLIYDEDAIENMKQTSHFHSSLALITALLVLLVALLAGGCLWILRGMHNQLAHAEATRNVLLQGRTIVAHLARQPVVKDASIDTGWGEFSKIVRSLHAVENGLQYVSVRFNGVTVFHEQTDTLDAGASGETNAHDGLPPSAEMTVGRRVLTAGSTPVVTFTLDFKGDDGEPRSVEVALKKDTVEHAEGSVAHAIESMFKVALVTVIVSFAVCVILVVWMMHRETIREQQRREEEHLVFAGVLANGIVHDFRNPMSSMQLDVQMLQKEAAKKEACRLDRLRELADRIQATMDRMERVFQEFFYLSKPAEQRAERVDLVNCIHDCVNIMMPGFEQAGVKAELEMSVPKLEVVASETFLRRAIVNLLTNAKQFSKSGDTIRIRLSVEAAHAIIDVIDKGSGVPDSEKKRIFEMFVTTRPGGTGLGLFLAKTAVERSGGTIQVLDHPGGGSCFRITLPLAVRDRIQSNA